MFASYPLEPLQRTFDANRALTHPAEPTGARGSPVDGSTVEGGHEEQGPAEPTEASQAQGDVGKQGKSVGGHQLPEGHEPLHGARHRVNRKDRACQGRQRSGLLFQVLEERCHAEAEKQQPRF